jgi:hypothetical protein
MARLGRAFPQGTKLRRAIAAVAATAVIGSVLVLTPTLPDGVLTLGLLANTGTALDLTPTLPSGTISLGAVGLTGTALPLTATLPAGALTLGALGLTGSALSLPPTLPAGSLTLGTLTITGTALSLGLTLPSGTTTAGLPPPRSFAARRPRASPGAQHDRCPRCAARAEPLHRTGIELGSHAPRRRQPSGAH